MSAALTEFRKFHRPVAKGVCVDGGSWVASCSCNGDWFEFSCGHGTNLCPWPFLGDTSRPAPSAKPMYVCRVCRDGAIVTPDPKATT
jgi:hypothetical protein